MPDLILTNGVVRTFNPAQPLAAAVAVRDGRIIEVGTAGQISAGQGTEVIDLRGRTLLPGFIDAHQHQLYLGLSLGQVDATPQAVSSIEDIVDRVHQRARVVTAGMWIEGRGFHDARLAERRNPTRADLDRATRDHPVFITRMCGHVMALNSRALELAGIGHDTPDPPGGTIERDLVTGEPTGVLRETAMSLLRRVVPPPDDPTLRQAILEGAQRNLRQGVTSVWEPSIEPDHLHVYREMDIRGDLPLRVTMAHKKVLRSGEEVPLPERFTGERLSLVAVKLFQDGGFGAATAALNEPYSNAPETSGQLVWDQEQLNERARAIHRGGLRISVHAIGDAAIASALDAIASALDGAPPGDYRHRIEHCGLPLPPLPERLVQLGIVPVLQPHFLWFDGDVYVERVGQERARWLYPIKTLLDHGLQVAGSSDGPVVPDTNPLLGVYAAVTRQSQAGRLVAPEEAVTVEQALSLFTIRAAYACGEEYLKGSIEPGKVADFVVLQADPLAVPVEDLPQIPVDMVFVGGQQVYFA